MHARQDEHLAHEVAAHLTTWGMTASIDGDPSYTVTDLEMDAELFYAVTVVLFTPPAMRDVLLQQRTATAIVQAQRNPTKIIIPLLLDPTSMFCSYEWLAPGSADSRAIALEIFEAIHDPLPTLPPAQVDPITGSERDLQMPALTAIRAAITRSTYQRRAIRMTVALMALANAVVVILLLMLEPDDQLFVLLVASLTVTFMAAVLGFRLGWAPEIQRLFRKVIGPRLRRC